MLWVRICRKQNKSLVENRCPNSNGRTSHQVLLKPISLKATSEPVCLPLPPVCFAISLSLWHTAHQTHKFLITPSGSLPFFLIVTTPHLWSVMTLILKQLASTWDSRQRCTPHDVAQHLLEPYCFWRTLSKRHCLLSSRQWAFFLLVVLAGALSQKWVRFATEKTSIIYPHSPSLTLFHPRLNKTLSRVSDHNYMLKPHIIQ